jgi:hypothetical protein
VQHAEVDAQVVGPDGVPILTVKLHTHDDGLLPFTFTPLVAGPHALRLVPFSLGLQPVVFVNPASWSAVPFDVAPGDAWPLAQAPVQPDPAPAPSSSDSPPALAALATILAGLLVTTAVVLRKRRT